MSLRSREGSVDSVTIRQDRPEWCSTFNGSIVVPDPLGLRALSLLDKKIERRL